MAQILHDTTFGLAILASVWPLFIRCGEPLVTRPVGFATGKKLVGPPNKCVVFCVSLCRSLPRQEYTMQLRHDNVPLLIPLMLILSLLANVTRSRFWRRYVDSDGVMASTQTQICSSCTWLSLLHSPLLNPTGLEKLFLLSLGQE